MLVNARAASCATNNHCSCLIRGHYSSNCRRQNTHCSECNWPHHALLHGAECQFPISQADQGNHHSNVLMVRAPQPSIRPVLLAIVKVVIEANSLSYTAFAVLDPGSKATLIMRTVNLLHLKGPLMSVQFGSSSSSMLIKSGKLGFRLKLIDGAHDRDSKRIGCIRTSACILCI